MTESIIREIQEWKVRRNAVILAHNYQRPEVQDVGDFVGDSLELSRKAAATEAAVIVFCGVHFMAETAFILNPKKTVLLPDPNAGCPMANMITPGALTQKKAEHPGAPVVCYVNSTASVKALSDVCCTSSNALAVVESLPGDEVLFVPDYNLGHWVSTRTAKRIILWDGFCPTHVWIKPADVARLRAEHPQAVVMVHPECSPDVVEAADEVLSTGQMLRAAHASAATEFIIGTEMGILHRLAKENPGKAFHQLSGHAVCPNMKKITLEKVLESLRTMTPEVRVEEPEASAARRALDRMLAVR